MPDPGRIDDEIVDLPTSTEHSYAYNKAYPYSQCVLRTHQLLGDPWLSQVPHQRNVLMNYAKNHTMH